MWKTTLIVVSIVAVAGLSPAQDSIFTDDFEWGSICAWSNLWYADSDGDDWGATGTTGIPVSCPPPGGYAPNQGDCDDISPMINPGEDELCDLIDNDCDPTTGAGIDEPWFGELCDGLDSDLCNEGVFECINAMQVCTDESDDNIEICNSIDDDCDTVTPDGFGELWFGDPCDGLDADLCEEGSLGCTNAAQVCSDDSPDNIELCNTSDDDCDPTTPDGFGELWFGDPCDGLDADLCEEGSLGCTNAAQVCSDDSPDNIELCNTSDDDCDPTTPDGMGELWFGDTCDGIDGDLCEEGVSTCVGGLQSCNDETDDLLDICDGFDNDCDQTSPDGSEDPSYGVDCDTGMLGICETGTTLCTGGALSCEQTSFPAGETCDGLDNDCDGSTDEGNPGGGASCDTGMLGICAAGMMQCTGGALACEPDNSPTGEICDGLDNDCDGVSDEGNPGGGAPCDTGMPGVCETGTTMCTNGDMICEPSIFPASEICDGLDNDCDGVPDEGNPGGGAPCDTGMLGVCAQGTTTCQSGSLHCLQDVAPSAEICNDFVDNDCDGAVDCDDPSCDFDPWCW